MQIGVSFDGFAPYGEALTFAREAAAAGAGSLWMADHLGYREPIVSCLGFASAIEGVRVIPTAVSPYLRHPMPTAMQMATLAEAAPGRVALALGTGNPLFSASQANRLTSPSVSPVTSSRRCARSGRASPYTRRHSAFGCAARA